MKLWSTIALLGALSPVQAVLQDEAYVTDFHHQLLGVPQRDATFFHRPSISSRASLIYTVSEQGIAGAINPKDGKIVWRQSLTKDDPVSKVLLEAAAQDSIAFTGADGTVTAWDAAEGKLVWDYSSEGIVSSIAVLELLESGSNPKDVAVAFEGESDSIKRLSGSSGAVVWEHKLSGHNSIRLATSDTELFVTSSPRDAKSKVTVAILDLLSGNEKNKINISTDVPVKDLVYIGTNSPAAFIAWNDQSSFKVNILGSKHVSSFPIQHQEDALTRVKVLAPKVRVSEAHFLVHYQTERSDWAEVYHIELGKSTVAKAYDLPRLAAHGEFAVGSQDANVYFVRIAAEEVSLFSSSSHGILGRWQIRKLPALGGASHAAVEVVQKTASSYAVRVAIISAAGDIHLLQNDKTVWTRHESCSGTIAAEWAVPEDGAELARQLEVEGHQSLVDAYVHRVKRHIEDLQHLPAWVNALPEKLLSLVKRDESKGLSASLQQTFGFQRVIVGATKSGNMYALDTASAGSILWSVKAVDLAPGESWGVVNLLALKEGEMTVVEGDGSTLTVSVKTGEIVATTPPGKKLISTAVVQEAGPAVIGFHDDNTATVVAGAFENIDDKLYFVINSSKSVKGVRLTGAGPSFTYASTWEFVPSPGQSVERVVFRPAHDPIASIGKVLGDRAVHYKYINPNALLVLSASAAGAGAITLLDGVSGTILYSAAHSGLDSAQPVQALLAENWFVYTFWGDSPQGSKSYQITINELYESSLANHRGPLGSAGNFSSLDAASAAQPFVISQSFVIPEGISGFAVSATRQGIAMKEILGILSVSNGLVAIPKFVLDAKRPIGRDPTAAEQEEGLIRYAPVIELDPKRILTHKRELLGIEKIITTPANLESTSLVFAYGTDLFGTRITPSQAFDVLGDAFNKPQLILTVFAVVLGVMFVAPLVKKKQINAKWSM